MGGVIPEPVNMFVDALATYIKFHKQRNFSNDAINEVERIFDKYKSFQTPQNSRGGTIHIERAPYNESEQQQLAKLFTQRHSIRDFESTPVNERNLRSAIELATRCPSACNRQCYRLYIVDKKDFSLLEDRFEGVGGFAGDLDKMLIVSGNMSVYRPNEAEQWIVTASIFAAYLSLALEVFNIGCCFIQRTVLPTKDWDVLAKRIGAQGDEQLVCCMGIGNLKKSYDVPISHRMDISSIVKEVHQ